ncbi:MAG: hypothetical protein EZS28_037840 [Streblomastix strix]|uniref:Uncharacterized protein n=1 Tax=Streblomastix strix TaxID=222440 RepID=A0A5J4U8U5_9EUKA|nr:MAG: hypothetical protein EZS28_037840 [Streblomastix strix]
MSRGQRLLFGFYFCVFRYNIKARILVSAELFVCRTLQLLSITRLPKSALSWLDPVRFRVQTFVKLLFHECQ